MTSPAVMKQPSLWEDLLEIFYAPRAVFERRRETPAFGLALLVLVIAAVGLTFAFGSVTEPIMDAETRRSMVNAAKKNPGMNVEQAMAAAKGFQKFIPFVVGGYFLFVPLILGLITWLLAKVVDSKAQLGQIMMVVTYSFFPRLIESIIGAVQVLVLPEESMRGRYSVSLGIGRFLDPDTQMMALSILGRVDLFTIWVTFIIAVGISVMGKVPMARAAIAAALVWVIGALPGVLGAAMA